MPGILGRMEEEIKNALKSKHADRRAAVRLIKSAVKNKEIELIRPLTDEEFIGVLSSMAKRHKESIEQFEKAGRTDLVEKEKKELAVVETFLPKAFSDSEIAALIAEALHATNAKGPKDMGLVMKALKEKTAGRVDGKKLSELVKQKLSTLAP
ncbi:MAG: GatB/YqeY domain-containing protein [Elusimicrobia bacterium]|nr:GatB/YqeY domain-containing protein [Elusimicrobiota bacterium]